MNNLFNKKAITLILVACSFAPGIHADVGFLCATFHHFWGQTQPSDCTGEQTITVIDYISFVNGVCGCLFEDPIVGTMAVVEPRSFMQGSPVGEPCRSSFSENEFHHTITRRILAMQSEVTRGMWADLLTAQPTLPADPTNVALGGGMNQPAQRMWWYEAVFFANLLSEERGFQPAYFKDPQFSIPLTEFNFDSQPIYCDWDANGFRLPFEGEWEHMARGNTFSAFSFYEPQFAVTPGCTSCPNPGDLPFMENHALFCVNNAGESSPVCSKLPNPNGLFDIHGNVGEWCWDVFVVDYPVSPQVDFIQSGSLARVYRGGTWALEPGKLRSARRFSQDADVRYSFVGFRLVRTFPTPN